jgi:hypothetical protein
MQAASRAKFIRLGLTDCVLLEAWSDDTVLLTDDLDLYLSAMHNGRRADYFIHIRQAAGYL